MTTLVLFGPRGIVRQPLGALIVGTLWALAVTAMEFAALPAHDGAWSSYAVLLIANVAVWSAVGVVVVLSVEFASSRRHRRTWLLCCIPGVALLVSLAMSWLLVLDMPWASFVSGAVYPSGGEPLASFIFQAWVVLFYGGLYATVATLSRRAEQTRGLLARARLARTKSDVMLAQKHLELLRGHVDPRWLLQALEEIERRFVMQSERADDLLAKLVTFLQRTLPVVRTTRSTLAEEAGILRAYCDLHADLVPDGPDCVVDIDEDLPNVPFVPLLLLAVVAEAESSDVRVVIARRRDRLQVDVHCDAEPTFVLITPQRDFHIRVALSRLFGRDWTLEHSHRTASMSVPIGTREPLPREDES